MQNEPPIREQQCDVVVIGAGMSGLIAASKLAESTDVLLLEATGRPGGRVESVRHGDYWVNVGAQFAEGTGPLFDAMNQFKVKRVSLADKRTALALKDRWVTMNNPALMVLRSQFTLRGRVDLAVFGLRLRWAHWRLAKDWNRERARAYRGKLDERPGSVLGRGVRADEVHALISDLSGQWLGCEPEETAATQLVFSIGTALEKAAKVPNFSLPVGGNQTLVEALAASLGERLRLNSPVQSVTWTAGGVTVNYADAEGRARLAAKRAVVAVPADVAATIMPDLPTELSDALGAIEYGRYVIVGMFTTERGKQRWDDYYAISTPELCFQMVFNHAAAVRDSGPRKPGGALVCFSGGSRADEQLTLPDEEIKAQFQRDLIRLLPELEGQIEHVVIRRQHRVVPFWRPGERASVRSLRDPIGPIHLAGDYLIGVPSLADAAASGERAAKDVLDHLARH
jgi:monoamine oxidase